MADANQSGLKSLPGFEEDSRASIIEPNTDSTELWLIQWPKDHVPDFDGEQISLDLRDVDGRLGTFEASSGKLYDVLSSASQEPKATVFLSSSGESKIFGKITRRVSFAHYLDPSEVPNEDVKRKKEYERSRSTSMTNSAYNFATPTKSIRPAQSSGRASTHSSGHRSSLSEEKVRPKPSRSGENSSHGSDRSEEKKAKKKKHMA